MAVHFVVPGELDTLTGGYLYDRHIVEGLRASRDRVTVHSLGPSFPTPSAEAVREARAVFSRLADGSRVVVDGLALGGLSDVLAEAAPRLRIVALVHHPLALETGLSSSERERLFAAERDALAHVRAVIVTSRWTRDALRDYDVAPERIAVVEPGTRSTARRRGPAQQPHRLLCVASLTPRKGHAVLLDALAMLGRHDWQLDCIGSLDMDRACADAVIRQIARLGLTERVRLCGEVAPAELPARYAEADTFVLASFMEGYGMASVEALAAGVPVVSTRAGAIPHVLPAAACVLVPPGDAAALAAALERLLDEPGVWEALAAAAATVSDGLPSWDDAVAAFRAALDEA